MPQVLAPLVTFAAYAIRARVSESEPLSVATAFSSLAIVSLVTGPTVLLLASIPALRVAFDCIDRIQTFCESALNHPALDQRSSESDVRTYDYDEFSGSEPRSLSMNSSQYIGKTILDLTGVDLRPAPTADALLINATAAFPAVPLTVITGTVGCGKTTLFKAILNELVLDVGLITKVSNSVAYCSQIPWIPNRTIRDVICGPIVFEQDWYDSVTLACDLQYDFSQMSMGDLTIAGSRGCTLSGGQRQRLVSIVPLPFGIG